MEYAVCPKGWYFRIFLRVISFHLHKILVAIDAFIILELEELGKDS